MELWYSNKPPWQKAHENIESPLISNPSVFGQSARPEPGSIGRLSTVRNMVLTDNAPQCEEDPTETDEFIEKPSFAILSAQKIVKGQSGPAVVANGKSETGPKTD